MTRTDEIGSWARSNGFTFPGDPEDEGERLPLILIQATVDRDVHHLCRGTWEDADVVCFDLRRGSAPTVITSTCAVTTIPYDFPTLLLTNRRALDGLESLTGLPSLSLPTVDDAFELRGRTQTLPERLLTGELWEWLLRWSSEEPFFSYEVSGSWLMTYAPLLAMDSFTDLLDSLLGFRDRIPEEAFDRYPMS